VPSRAGDPRLVAFLLSDGDLDCEAGGFAVNAKSVNITAGTILSRVSTASIGAHPELVDRVQASERQVSDLLDDAKHLFKAVPKRCKSYYKPMVDTAPKVDTALQAAEEHLTQLDFEHMRRVAEKEAREPARYEQPVGTNDCDDAEDLVNRLGRGSGKRNHVVYWSPPPFDSRSITSGARAT
jgi:hypothetical protein